MAATRKAIGWAHEPFVIPDELRAAWDHRGRGAAVESAWRELLARYGREHPDLARELERRMRGELPADWRQTAATGAGRRARAAGPAGDAAVLAGHARRDRAAHCPRSSAAPPTSPARTTREFKGARELDPTDASGDYIHYGVREFGMTAVMNGIALHGGFLPYGGTFLVFSDYARNAVRLAALMNTHVVLVYTHDSIGLGEDGPTHQPIEHLTSLRAMPNLCLWRPCDAFETAVAWVAAVERAGPTALVLTRQALPQQARDGGAAGQCSPRRIRSDRLPGHPRVPGDRDRLRGRPRRARR